MSIESKTKEIEKELTDKFRNELSWVEKDFPVDLWRDANQCAKIAIEHARNRSIEFLKWKYKNNWIEWRKNYLNTDTDENATPDQLYELFSQQIDNHSIDK